VSKSGLTRMNIGTLIAPWMAEFNFLRYWSRRSEKKSVVVRIRKLGKCGTVSSVISDHDERIQKLEFG